MPEYHLPEKEVATREESPFVLGFIEALFFTECASGYTSDEWFTDECKHDVEEGCADGSIPSDVGYSDLHPDALEEIRKFCQRKQTEMAPLLALAYERDGYSEERAGNDLLYTYVGHGVGYWDRDELEEGGLGDKLTAACGRGEVNPFFGGHVKHGDAPFVHVSMY